MQHLAKTIPQRFVAKSGGGNRVGRIFIDYLRNGHGATTAAAFSARARPGLGVSMPVAWEQLPALKSGAQWTITTAREYLAFQQTDPWADYWTTRQTLAAGHEDARLQRRRQDATPRVTRRRTCPYACGPLAQRGGTRELRGAPMAARSIASLSLSFGLVSIPVKLYSATESSATVRFNLLDKDGSRLKQQYVSEKDQHVVERAEMVKGYEFEKDRFVIFQPEELKALQESPSHTIDIVAFIPDKAIDPIFYDKAYYLAPDKRGGKPYNLLMQAMRESGRFALAKWAWKAKQYVVQVRPAEDGLVLQQLLYADEVRSMKELDIEKVTVTPAELKLAMQLIEQISEDTYDPTMFEDEEKKRILAAIDEKIAGKQIVANEPPSRCRAAR